jgi:hypothetical protein
MQGYLFSPAKPAAAIRQLLDREGSAAAHLNRSRKRRQISNPA